VSGRALVTGGAGFIGSHLAETLLERGWQVDAVDDLSTGSVENLDHLIKHPGFAFTLGSAMDGDTLAPLVATADVVFHLAAAVGVRLVVEQPVHTIKTNIGTTETLLALAAERRCRVLLASTSEVYGKLDGHRFSENDDVVLGPTSRSRWSYAASKIIEEFLGIAYAKERGIPVTIMRLFNTIGPRQTGQYGMVVPRFVRQALQGEPLTVYGDGTQRRSFTWVGDVVNAMITLVQHPGAIGEVFNLGHTKDIEIRALAALVKQLTHSESDITHVAFEQAYESGFEDMPRRLPDISKIARLIGYRPTLDLTEMLERIIRHMRAESAATKAPAA
jgi:UDP-glucose 4-epimerase